VSQTPATTGPRKLGPGNSYEAMCWAASESGQTGCAEAMHSPAEGGQNSSACTHPGHPSIPVHERSLVPFPSRSFLQTPSRDSLALISKGHSESAPRIYTVCS
jgi:hypothetical protein